MDALISLPKEIKGPFTLQHVQRCGLGELVASL